MFSELGVKFLSRQVHFIKSALSAQVPRGFSRTHLASPVFRWVIWHILYGIWISIFILSKMYSRLRHPACSKALSPLSLKATRRVSEHKILGRAFWVSNLNIWIYVKTGAFYVLKDASPPSLSRRPIRKSGINRFASFWSHLNSRQRRQSNFKTFIWILLNVGAWKNL